MNKQILYVYLAGGLKSGWQDLIITECLDLNIVFFNPTKHNLELDSKLYTNWDLFHVSKSDIIFAFMENDNPSGLGLSLEIGYAKGLGKTIILVDEKSPMDKKFAKYFEIVHHSSDVVFDNLEKGLSFLKRFSEIK